MTEQEDPTDTQRQKRMEASVACFVMIARFHGHSVEAAQVAYEFADPEKGFGKVEMLLAAKKLGLIARSTQPSLQRLSSAALPAIAADAEGRHFIVARCDASDQPDLLSAGQQTHLRVISGLRFEVPRTCLRGRRAARALCAAGR